MFSLLLLNTMGYFGNIVILYSETWCGFQCGIKFLLCLHLFSVGFFPLLVLRFFLFDCSFTFFTRSVLLLMAVLCSLVLLCFRMLTVSNYDI